jgi:multicomponent Na+:H+ antiporter subunit G
VTAVIAVPLVVAVLAAWLATAAFIRLGTPLERLHAVSLLNVASGSAVTVAVFLADGATNRSLKCGFIWGLMVVCGALFSHASRRALHLRGGETR